MKFNFTALKSDGSVFYTEDVKEDHSISRLKYLTDRLLISLRLNDITHIIIEVVEE